MKWWKDYFSFTKRERTAFIIVILLIGGFIFLPDLFPSHQQTPVIPEEVKKVLAARDSLAATTGNDERPDASSQPFTAQEQNSPPALFYFDPNTLDQAGFEKLGLSARTASTILKYRSKGGRFKQPEDLRKIYSLAKKDADRIIPYVRINGSEDKRNGTDKNGTPHSSANNAIRQIDINTATLEEWKSLPGIGDVIGNRIVKFRERMGGFSYVDQVSKTFGLKDSVFQRIKPYLKLTVPVSNKININSAYENELMECAAITADIARAIVIYRKKNGNFNSTEELKKIVFITDAVYREILPCISVN